jgi:hypothetical protein
MTLETYLEDLSDLLVERGFCVKGQTYGQDPSVSSITISGYHDANGNYIFITPYTGIVHQEIKTGEDNSSEPSVQFLVRHESGEVALKQSTAIYKLLRALHDTDVGNTHIIWVSEKGPPAFVMRTNGGFYEYSTNFSINIQA